MKWNNVEPGISSISLDMIAKGRSVFDVLKLLSHAHTSPVIIIDDDVKVKIMRHLRSKNVELGGLLLGNVVSLIDLKKGIIAVKVTNAFESRDFDSTSVSLRMNSNVWQSANQSCTNNRFVVGWYHSHPNLGAFFSGTDRKTQRDFFNNAYNVGLVIDPVRNEERWFIGESSSALHPNSILEGNQWDGAGLVG